MDSKSDFLKELLQVVSALDEDFFVGLSNRGLYNRAVKDLGDGRDVILTVEDSFVRIMLADGTSCELTSDIKKYKCSCPSRSVCKHVLMGFIYLKGVIAGTYRIENSFLGKADSEKLDKSESPGIAAKTSAEMITTPSESEKAPADRADKPAVLTVNPANAGKTPTKTEDMIFSKLLEIGNKEIRKRTGDRNLNNILCRIQFGVRAVIDEASVLTISFPEENIQVRFPPVNPLENAICSCKAGDFCMHKAEALVHYRLSKGIAFEDPNENTGIGKGISTDGLNEIRRFIVQLLVQGLARMPESTLESVEQMAVISHNSNIPNLERLFRRLGTEAELYFKRNAAFSRSRMRNMISAIYNLTEAISLNGEQPSMLSRLAGKFKSSYIDIPPFEMTGAGAEAWVTKSGYTGVTWYFYSGNMMRWLTYSVSRPTFYEGRTVTAADLYKSDLPWGLEGDGEFLSKSIFRLTNGKMNEDGRLSSGMEGKAQFVAKTNASKFMPRGYCFDDWAEAFRCLSEKLQDQELEPDDNYNLFVIQISSWGKSSFDKIKQEIRIPVYDEEDRNISILVKFTADSKKLIERLEQNEKLRRCPFRLLGRMYSSEGEVYIYPITAYYKDGSMTNLTLL